MKLRLRPVLVATAVALGAIWIVWAFSVLAGLGCGAPLGFCPLAP